MNAALATHRTPTRLLVAVALAFFAMASQATSTASVPLPTELEPATQVSSVQVLDSNIEVPNSNFYAYWLDDETVIFNAKTEETWEHWTPLRQVPVIRIATWNVKTKEVRYFEEMSSYLCWWRGNVVYTTYPRSSTGERVRRDGRYVEEFRFGTMSANASGLSIDPSISPDTKIDHLTCQPESRAPPIPEWIVAKGWRYNRLPGNFGVKIDRPGGSAGTVTAVPIICSYGSAAPADCRALPLPGKAHYFAHYVEHVDSLLLEGQGAPHEGLLAALVHRIGAVTSYSINRDKRGALPLSALATRAGLVRILPNSGSPYVVGDGGIWLWNKGDPRRLATLFSYPAQTGQRAVSPSGCRIAFSGSERPPHAARTLRVAKLCGSA